MDEYGARSVYRITSGTGGMVRAAAWVWPNHAPLLVASPVVAPLLIAVDFDGTITLRDTLHVIVDAHGRRGAWDELQPDLRSGRITVEQAMQQQFSTVTASHDEVAALIRSDVGVREGFTDLVAHAADEGHRLVVMSAGFRSVIDLVLGDIGLGHLEVVANDAVFSAEGCQLVWGPDRGDVCVLCDRRCKRHAIRMRHRGEAIVYVGDGISDRCASQMADVVFARDDLAEHLSGCGVAFTPYEDFHEVITGLRLVGAHAGAA